MTNVCKHGQLARSCEICEAQGQIAELEAEVARLESGLAAATQQYTELSERDNSVMDAALRERTEMCAKVAENFHDNNPWPTVYGAIAAAIRALLKP